MFYINSEVYSQKMVRWYEAVVNPTCIEFITVCMPRCTSCKAHRVIRGGGGKPGTWPSYLMGLLSRRLVEMVKTGN